MVSKVGLCMSENIFILLSKCIASLPGYRIMGSEFFFSSFRALIYYLLNLMWLMKSLGGSLAFPFGSLCGFFCIIGFLRFQEDPLLVMQLFSSSSCSKLDRLIKCDDLPFFSSRKFSDIVLSKIPLSFLLELLLDIWNIWICPPCPSVFHVFPFFLSVYHTQVVLQFCFPDS